MPPHRAHIPVRPVKVERTHEENQERAYIAASRRSDRSLEARVESARRASEIHKRRCGRGLKVTEQDVMNEEMYEEEDDHHMNRFANLTRGIATGNPSMDRSVQAMIAAQIGMREHMSSLFNTHAAANANFEQHFPGYSSQLNNQNLNPSAFDQHAPMHMDPQAMQSMNTRNMNPSNNMHTYNNRPAPYPANTNGNMAHSRSASIALPAHQAQPQQVFAHQPGFNRRHSMATSQSQQSASTSPSVNAQPFMQENGSYFGSSYTTTSNQYNMMNNDFTGFTDPFAASADDMFTSALPVESQQMIGNNFNPSVFDASLMNGYGSMNQQWDFATNAPRNVPNPQKNNHRGLDSTLAPPAMSRTSSQGEFNSIGGPNSGMGFIDLGYIPSSQPGSAATTPGVDGWENFINEGCWDSHGGN